MADEKVLNENGVPMSDGLGGTESSTDTNTGQGGGSTATTVNTSDNDTVGGTTTTESGSNSSGSTDNENVKIVKDAIDTYLGASAIATVLNQIDIVEIYVDYKLGFAKLKEEYKKKNPDVDPDKVDEAVDEERASAVKEFKKEGSPTKADLQKKYDDLRLSASEAQKNISNILQEFLKTTTEAAMPNVVGPIAPNPFSISLKLYNGLSKLKKILDRVTISMKVLMTAVESLGLDQLPADHQFSKAYNSLLGIIAGPLKTIQSNIAKSEADNAEDMFVGEAINKFKENYWVDNFDDSGRINGKAIEEFTRDDQDIYEWPLNKSSRNKLFRRRTKLSTLNKALSREFFRITKAIEYNTALNSAIIEAKQSYLEFKKTNVSNNSTTTNTTGGGSDKGPGGNVFIGTK